MSIRKTMTKIGVLCIGAYMALVSAIPALAAEEPKKERLSASISSSLLNKYVAINGPTLVDNPVNQTMVSANLDRLLSYVWMNYDLRSDRATEIDFSTKYKLPEFQTDFGAFSAMVGYELWTYPQTRPYSMDPAGFISVGYSGPEDINLNLTIKKLLNVEGDDGYQLTSNISRTFKFPIRNIGFSITPSISTAYLDNFFGGNGFSYIRAGGSFNANLPKGLQLNASAFYQMSLNHEVGEDTPILGIGLSKSF